MKKRIIAVRHTRREGTKEYWFNVPENITCDLQIGDTVYCNTSQGISEGYVTKIIEKDEANGVNSIKLIEEKKNNVRTLVGEFYHWSCVWSCVTLESNPTESIIGKKVQCNLEDIKISKAMRRTRPALEKLQNKIAVYYMNGRKALSPIIIKSSGELIDGYTTYLIHKMFDLPVNYIIMI